MRLILVLIAALFLVSCQRQEKTLMAEESTYLLEAASLVGKSADHLERASDLLDQVLADPELASDFAWQRSFSQEIAGLNSAYLRYKQLNVPPSLSRLHNLVTDALDSATTGTSLVYKGIVDEDPSAISKGFKLLDDASSSFSEAEAELDRISRQIATR